MFASSLPNTMFLNCINLLRIIPTKQSLMSSLSVWLSVSPFSSFLEKFRPKNVLAMTSDVTCSNVGMHSKSVKSLSFASTWSNVS